MAHPSLVSKQLRSIRNGSEGEEKINTRPGAVNINLAAQRKLRSKASSSSSSRMWDSPYSRTRKNCARRFLARSLIPVYERRHFDVVRRRREVTCQSRLNTAIAQAGRRVRAARVKAY